MRQKENVKPERASEVTSGLKKMVVEAKQFINLISCKLERSNLAFYHFSNHAKKKKVNAVCMIRTEMSFK